MQRVLIALALASGLAACGFTPMYAKPGVSSGLARIDVQTPNTRTGYLLRESLEDALAWDRTAAPAYRLRVDVTESRYPRGLRVDDTATRYELALSTSYVLTDVRTGAAVLQGARPVAVTYDAAEQPYAGIAAQEDGQARAADQAAELIRIDLMKFFAGYKPPK